jgi:arylsulfatase A-like enzyme
MSLPRRPYRWILWLLVILLVGLGLYWGHSRRQAMSFQPAPFTPDGPQVGALRDPLKDANLVICVIDAARADHLGSYGYPRPTTPNINQLARESLVFERHFTQYASTKPSTASLFTSQFSDTHLVLDKRTMSESTFTMARGLQRAGFRTALFSSNPNASPGMGIGLDFQEKRDQVDVKPFVRRWEELTRPEPLLSLFGSWLGERKRSRFFAYIHLDPPHQPYLQPEAMTALFKGQQPPHFQPGGFEFPEVGDRKTLAKAAHPPLPGWVNLYDANLRYADWSVGEVVRLLREAGVLENTLLVVTSDHGEAFGEHGYIWHERGVYDELAHIPLLIRWPGGAGGGRRIKALTQTVDLLPTVFDLLRAPYPREGIQGRSLLPLVAGLTDKVHDSVFCRSDGDPPSYLVRSLDYALILYGNGKWRALYDLKADPGERRNLAAKQPEQTKELVAAFRKFAHTQRRPPLDFLEPGVKLPPLPDVPSVDLTPEVKRQLHGLGYVR